MKALLFLLLLLPSIALGQTCVNADLTHPLTVTANWQKNATDNTGFTLERKLNAGTYAVLVTSTDGTLQSFVDSTVVRAATPNTYTYRIKNEFAGGIESAYSAEACITFAAQPSLLPPSGLTLSALDSQTIELVWEEVPNNNGYEIQGKISRGNTTYALVADVAVDQTIYQWGNLQRHTPYCAIVKTRGASGDSAFSTPVCHATTK